MRQPAGLAWVAVALGLGGAVAPALAQTAPRPAAPASTQQQIDELKQLILQQQATIQELQKRVEQLQGQTAETQQAVTAAKEELDATRKAAAEKPLITSGEPKVKLAISGQVNRIINVADDGHSTKAYFVDNNNSNSRVRFAGTAQYSEDVTIGSLIEFGLGPNNSNNVSQFNEDDGGTFLDERKVEIYGDSKTLGRVTLGKGSSAADGISEVDLSGTDVITYAAISDLAGGLFFINDGGNQSSGVQVKNAFNDLDGPRYNRIRYDSPTFAGLQASGDFASNQRGSATLRWGGEWEEVKAAAGIGWQDPNQSGKDSIYSGSVSLLHTPTGLNATLSAGEQGLDDHGPASNLYGKLGWRGNLVEIGESRVSIDYTSSTNFPTYSDEGWSVGGFFVQNIAGYGTELFAGLRVYALDRNDNPSVGDIIVGTMGSRVKF